MTKYFVLRPHALLSSYDSTMRFGEDNVVVVPLAVIDEITDMKDLSIEKDKIKRRVLEYISSFDYTEDFANLFGFEKRYPKGSRIGHQQHWTPT